MSESVRVVVRVRPLSKKESQDGHEVVTVAEEGRGTITCSNPRGDEGDPPKAFTFDAVFGCDCSQKAIYDTCSAPVVEAVLSGFNGTIFAYGQTGAGKTFTMEGASEPPELRGIIPNAFQHIFDRVAVAEETKQFLVRGSYLEIYNEEIRDLLAKDPKNRLELKENLESGVYVKDLTSFVVKSSHEIDQVMQAGKKNRSVGATLMNAGSSRSHAIFTIIVECCETDAERGSHIHVGKLNLVDLAGSERQAKTGATGDRLKEATKINLSLSALGNVISALVDGKSQHIPYRDSKLTRLLQDSLGGNTKTVMCANCGPAGYNYDETISTLRYANRAKNIKNKPKINEDPKDAMLREFQDEIKRLKDQLAAQQPTPATSGPTTTTAAVAEAKVVRERVVEKLVEVEKIVEIKGVATDREVAELKEAANAEQAEIWRRAEIEMKEVLDSQSRSSKERDKLQQKLEAEAEKAAHAEKQRRALEKKLKSMEEKLVGGKNLLDKAAKQEAMLRRAQSELEERKAQEEALARKVAEKEEENYLLEEKFASKTEEADIKTRKLQKLWKRLQVVQAESQDIQVEFQTEREDMLDTIRQLARQLKLKELLVNSFVPPEDELKIERHARWNDEDDKWTVAAVDIVGNRRRPSDNRTTKSSRPATASRSAHHDFSSHGASSSIQNPYHHYTHDDQDAAAAPKTSSDDAMADDGPPDSRARSSARSRPKSTRPPTSSRRKKHEDK
ncbi:hypothetical protein CTAYLR_007347 [Chrysophaeum taylorii]|uniref:Kinesin-like protein n=1 Tax=Chrysophaeum taylorii TaxID=2483200 RepID=A0AAD7UHT9_9STRA|nr:hypothetical protein CTAYLR_007347 [Chrysophaeum taylorii]